LLEKRRRGLGKMTFFFFGNQKVILCNVRDFRGGRHNEDGGKS